MNPLPRWLRGLLAAAVFLLVGGLLFLAAMDRDLNHDEHQFIAPGVLISREGLLPYRDFPMFHLPNLAFIYAGLDRLTHQPVFSAKVFNTLCSTLTGTLIFLAGTSRHRPVPLAARHIWFTLAALTLLLSDQLFTYTAGKTWNHELPAFLLIAAILAHVRSVEESRWGWAAVSGFCVGAAIGTRLTYLPVAAAFPCLLAFAPLPRRSRGPALAAWCTACLVALGPSIYFLCADRERFLFDNLEFPRLRLLDPTDTRVQKTMTWWRKVRYFFKEILAHSLPLTITFVIASIEPIRRRLKQLAPLQYGYVACLAVLPLAIFGCALPSRYQYQHYFVVVPLLALGCAYALRSSQPQTRWHWPALLAAAVLLALSPLNFNSEKRSGSVLTYKAVSAMTDSANWFTTRLRSDSVRIQSAIPDSSRTRPTLTLSPIGVLEAGGRIYPEFATGPFAWRLAGLLESEKRKRVGLIAKDDLAELLEQRPPAAILTGPPPKRAGEEEDLEMGFIEYAEAHSFKAVDVGKRRTVWLPPVDTSR